MTSYEIEDDQRTDPDVRGYRDLVSSILSLANEDCATGNAENAIEAYLWVVGNEGAYRRYCEVIGLDPDVFRNAFIEQHRQRCEKLLRARADHAEDVRDEEDRKAHIAGMRAVKRVQRDNTIRHNKLYANRKPIDRPPPPAIPDDEKKAIYRQAASEALYDMWRKTEARSAE